MVSVVCAAVRRKNNARYQRRYFYEWGVKEVTHEMEKKFECRLCRVDKPETSMAKRGVDGSMCVHTHKSLPRVPKFYKKLRLRAFKKHCDHYHQLALPLFRQKVREKQDLTAYDTVPSANLLDLGRDDRARVVVGRSSFEFLRRVSSASRKGPHPFKLLRDRSSARWAVAKPCRAKTVTHLQSQLKHTASFSALANILRSVGPNSKLDSRDTVTPALVSDVARITVAECLHHLSIIMRRSWLVTAEIDGVKVKGNKPFLTVRVNVPGPDRVWRFHVTAFRLKKRHKGLYMFKTFSMLMSALGGRRWAKQSGGLATDGAENLKGRFNGLLSHLRRHVTTAFVHHRCTPHRLSLTYNASMKWLKGVPRLEWVKMFKGLLKAIRGQHASEALGSLCPTTVTTRWNYFLRSIGYVDSRESSIRELQETEIPTEEWFWQTTHGLCFVCELFDGAFRALQTEELLTTAVAPIFKELHRSIACFSGAVILDEVPPQHFPIVRCVGNADGVQIYAGCCLVHVGERQVGRLLCACTRCGITLQHESHLRIHDAIVTMASHGLRSDSICIHNMSLPAPVSPARAGPSLREAVAQKTRRARKQQPEAAEDASSAAVRIAAMLVGGVCAVAINRLLWELEDFQQESAGRVDPKLYPLDVAGQPEEEFERLVDQMAPLMEGAFSHEQTKELAAQRRLLAMEVESRYGLRERLQRASVVTTRDGSQKPASLEASWKPLHGKHSLLIHFIMGVAAVSASIAGVERDNGLLKADMGDKRTSMGDVAFDSRMHARQLTELREAAACKLPVQRVWEEEDEDYSKTSLITDRTTHEFAIGWVS
eukprot:GHVU01064699.1.p1 GENE.GHVU01064699.1~~GHVU01064699.1.p1  ORF type:complete len:824 (+),score=81.00 GHVU01064699.1:431-2902(+)